MFWKRTTGFKSRPNAGSTHEKALEFPKIFFSAKYSKNTKNPRASSTHIKRYKCYLSASEVCSSNFSSQM